MTTDRDMSTERTMALYGVIFAGIGALGILFFWAIGAVLLLTGNGGTINDMGLGQLGRTLYLIYPVVAVVSLAAGTVLFLVRREMMAVGVTSLPIAGAVLFTFALVFLR